MRFKRVLLVLLAVVAAGVGFVPSSEAVTSPVITLVVPCNDESGVSSTELGLEAAWGLYSVTVLGACNWAGAADWSTTASTPCSTALGSTPCVTWTVANMPGDTCGTSLGFARVEACGPIGGTVSAASNCWYTVKINGNCLTNGWSQTMSLAGNVHAVFNDGPGNYFDNTGVFVVVVRQLV